VPGKILAAWRHGLVEVVLCTHILEELRRVLPRLKPRHGLNPAEIEDFIDILAIQAELIEPLPDVEPSLRDADDQPVLGALLAARKTSGADYLITGDKDLLALAARYPIVTPAQFWEAHAGL
jgi:putative PIN family toxin of toxin-antitoxin system